MRKVCAVVVFLVMVMPAWAQSATVAVFSSTVVDPNATAPVQPPVTYVAPVCNQPVILDQGSVTNPIEGAYADPMDPSRECRVAIAAQLGAVAAGTYKGAVRLGAGLYGPLSNAFTLAAQVAHPCDGTPASVPSKLVGQSFEFGWCHDGTDTNGTPTSLTAWRVYRNGVLLSGVSVSTGTVANGQGLVYSSFQRTETTSGVVTFETSAVNTVGESAKLAPVTVTITVPPAPPSAPVKGRIQ